MAGHLVGYFEVQLAGSDPNESPDLIDIYGNEQFYLGRNPALCRRHWADTTISSKHLRVHCILYEEKPVANIPPFVYVTDVSTNGTFLKKRNSQSTSSQTECGIVMGRQNGSFLLDDGDELRLSDSVTLIYHEMEEAEEHRLTFTQEREKQLFASRYLVTGRLLGIGGFGKVLVAIEQKTQRQLACKVVNLRGLWQGARAPNLRLPIPDETQQSMTTGARKRWPSKIARYFREFNILRSLNHPNIVSIEKVFWSASTIYMFEELVTGGDLFSYLEYKGGRLTDVETAVIIRQVLKGIEYLHDQDIVHRDLKPDNILLTSLEDGARIVITDFGNARGLPKHESTHQTKLKQRMFSVVGTLEFAAPEIHQQNNTIPFGHGYSKAIDMWSIGAITAAVLSGDVIFTNRNDPRYENDPFGVIMGLASRCDTSIIDDDDDGVWSKVGRRPKDFIKNLLLLREEDRLTATEALAHEWFSNDCHAAEFEALYDRSIRDWRPRRRIFRLVESIPEPSANAASYSHLEHMSSRHFQLASLANPVLDLPQYLSASQSQSQDTPLSPIAEEHEEAEFEGNRYCDHPCSESTTNRPSHEHTLSQIGHSRSTGDSIQQLSLDPEPPASGMYSTLNNLQDSYGHGESRNEALNKAYQTNEDSSDLVRYQTPSGETDSPIVHDTPIKVNTRDHNSLKTDSSITNETSISHTKKRAYSPDHVLPSYDALFENKKQRAITEARARPYGR